MMETSHSIYIEGFTNPSSFVSKWSKAYDNYDEKRYFDNINTVFDNWNCFREMFAWKNGMGDKIAPQKLKLVERFWDRQDILVQLKANFSWDLYEEVFEPAKTSNIWKLFLLHLINPKLFPIYDQHVYRFYTFHKKGVIKEISKNHNERYLSYKNDYLDWFRETKDSNKLDPKKMDEAFFSFGKMIKLLDSSQIEIIEAK